MQLAKNMFALLPHVVLHLGVCIPWNQLQLEDVGKMVFSLNAWFIQGITDKQSMTMLPFRTRVLSSVCRIAVWDLRAVFLSLQQHLA